jgi:hypothetical protein
MRTPGRIGLSFGCMLLSITIFLLWGVLHASSHRELINDLAIAPVYLLFAFPGWLLSLPLVMAIRDAEGWRGWVILLIGVSIGPGFLLVWAFLTAQSRGGRIVNSEGDGFFYIASLIISSLTTIFYVSVLKFTHRRSVALRQESADG